MTRQAGSERVSQLLQNEDKKVEIILIWLAPQKGTSGTSGWTQVTPNQKNVIKSHL